MTALLLWWALVVALPPIALSVSPTQGFPPLTTRAEIRIPRHIDNRHACVMLVQGGEVEDQSCWDVSIDSAPVFQRKWTGLLGGTHYAQARLLRGGDTFYSAFVTIRVAQDEP